MKEQLARPLAGKRILVTRTKQQAGALIDQIEQLGGEAYLFPVIKIVPPSDWTSVDRALAKLHTFDWLVFTSINGVEFFFQRLNDLGISIQNFRGKIAAVGTKTEQALQRRKISVDLLPKQFVGESMAAELRTYVQSGQHVLLPRGDLARNLLPEDLRRMGCNVTEIEVYENVPVTEKQAELLRLFRSGEIHVATFTSSSTVTNFVKLLAGENLSHLLGNVTIASIGPVTTETAEKWGLSVAVTAEPYTVEGMVDSLVKYFSDRT